MGLLDMVGGVLGGAQAQPGGGAGGPAELIAAVIGMLGSGGAGAPQAGGLGALIAAFQAHGMGDLAQSWVGTGQNLPLSADQLGQVLGPQQMGDLASKFGLSTGDLGRQLSQSLPQAVDQLTPNGQLPDVGLGGLGDLLGRLTQR